MEYDKEAFIDYRIKRSKETIKEAELSIKNNFLFNAENRIYYSIFYIVSALACKNNFKTSKHHQLLGWFNQNFVKTKIFDFKLWKIYRRAFRNRLEGDYEDFKVFELEQVKKDFENMIIFVEEIEKHIKK